MRSYKTFGPDRFSGFDVYWIKTNRQTSKVYIYYIYTKWFFDTGDRITGFQDIGVRITVQDTRGSITGFQNTGDRITGFQDTGAKITGFQDTGDRINGVPGYRG